MLRIIHPPRHIKAISPKFIGEIVGSYRRGKLISGDVDIIFTGPNILAILIKRLTESKIIVHSLSEGEVKFQGTYLYNHHMSHLDHPHGYLLKF